MMKRAHALSERLCGEEGFTLVETYIVLAIVAIIVAIAIPSYASWIGTAEYRASARSILGTLREARSKAIANNMEHRVEFDAANGRYRVMRGDRPHHSATWEVSYDWCQLSDGVHMTVTAETIHLNTNGTANPGTIRIKDKEGNTHFEVRIANTGRARIPWKL